MTDRHVIQQVHARLVLDSRGRPTVEVDVMCGNRIGRAIVPSGASKGQFEALELRDTELAAYDGLGVTKAISYVNGPLADQIIGHDACDQLAIDQILLQADGTPNKSKYGANSILGISLATAHAAATSQGIRLDEHLHNVWRTQIATDLSAKKTLVPTIPLPMVNMISGGLHAGGNLDFQDFLAIPVGATTFSDALEWIVRIYWRLGSLLNSAGYEGTLVGDEGGYGPKVPSHFAAAEFLVRAIQEAGLIPGSDVCLGLDVASTHFYENDQYQLIHGDQRTLSTSEMVDYLCDLVNAFPIISIEDGVADTDTDGWRLLTKRLADKVQLIGDDLFVTNPERFKVGIANQIANSILIKVNQIGTLTETMQAIHLAQKNDYWPVISARSGETEDSTMVDLAVATGAGQIKIGSVARSERLAKYNQLLRLEEALGADHYLGGKIFTGKIVTGKHGRHH